MWGLSAGIRSLHNKVYHPEMETISPKTECGCPCGGHEADDRADRRTGKATITSGSLLERSEVLRSLRHLLRARSQGHHTIDHLEERGVERGSSRQSSFKGRERAIVNQTNTRTVSKATFGKRSERRSGAHMGFSEGIDLSLIHI